MGDCGTSGGRANTGAGTAGRIGVADADASGAAGGADDAKSGSDPAPDIIAAYLAMLVSAPHNTRPAATRPRHLHHFVTTAFSTRHRTIKINWPWRCGPRMQETQHGNGPAGRSPAQHHMQETLHGSGKVRRWPVGCMPLHHFHHIYNQRPPVTVRLQVQE